MAKVLKLPNHNNIITLSHLAYDRYQQQQAYNFTSTYGFQLFMTRMFYCAFL